jgi:hypothetical protein
MSTYMRSDRFKSSASSSTPAASSSRASSAAPRSAAKLPEDEIPTAPPAPLRGEYLKVSWAYVYWCVGMLIWSVLCVVYFIMTRQTTNMLIGLALGALLIAMIVCPAMLFGGTTWYKRLGWMMLLLGLFSLMWVYPIVTVGWGIRKRIAEGRYRGHWSSEDIWHVALSGLTVIVSVWTLSVTWRCGRLVRQLYRGEFGVTEVKVRH